MFFWRTNFTPDWRIWVYKHLSWSSWLASLFGPRCTVFFVIYERLLRILVEADQILRFLSVILFNIHTPLTYPRSIHGTPWVYVHHTPRKRCIFELGSGDRDLGSVLNSSSPSGLRIAKRESHEMAEEMKGYHLHCLIDTICGDVPGISWRNFQRW